VLSLGGSHSVGLCQRVSSRPLATVYALTFVLLSKNTAEVQYSIVSYF
jgi:hypothetical protein